MALFLIYIFRKGPRWLRVLTWTAFTLLVIFGCFYAASNMLRATERIPASHVSHPHTR